MPVEFEELCHLEPPEIGRLSAEAPGICRVQIHPFYFGHTPGEVRQFLQHAVDSVAEWGETVSMDVPARIEDYSRYQVRRRDHVGELQDAWGVLFEEEHRIATSLAALREENPSVRWLVVRTRIGSWVPLYGDSRTESDAWSAVAERLKALGVRNVEVFGAMADFCVAQTAANLTETRRFDSVSIFEPATLH